MLLFQAPAEEDKTYEALYPVDAEAIGAKGPNFHYLEGFKVIHPQLFNDLVEDIQTLRAMTPGMDVIGLSSNLSAARYHCIKILLICLVTTKIMIRDIAA